jgi:hypothetical protein
VRSILLTDYSVASATGASQQLLGVNTARKALKISNPNASGSWWIDDTGGTAVANGASCIEIPPGAEWAPVSPPMNVITGIGAAASKLRVKEG